MSDGKKVGIIGSGLIGRSWAMLFSAAGYKVVLYDAAAEQVLAALQDIQKQLVALEASGMLRGTDNAAVQHSRISGVSSLKDCVSGAVFVQECIPENLELKQKIFREMDKVADPVTILSSSTSCIVPSKFTDGLSNSSNCLVSHPVNPPYFVPLVEIVPAPWTSPAVVQRTRDIMIQLGQEPVTFSREIDGFGLNRLQYAILNECNHMVTDGLLSVKDVDTLMTAGLGPRYTWMGPIETAHLNAEGMGNYTERYAKGIMNVVSQQVSKGVADLTLPASSELVKQIEEQIPLDTLQARREWRDERLTAFAALRTQMKKKEEEEAASK